MMVTHQCAARKKYKQEKAENERERGLICLWLTFVGSGCRNLHKKRRGRGRGWMSWARNRDSANGRDSDGFSLFEVLRPGLGGSLSAHKVVEAESRNVIDEANEAESRNCLW